MGLHRECLNHYPPYAILFKVWKNPFRDCEEGGRVGAKHFPSI